MSNYCITILKALLISTSQRRPIILLLTFWHIHSPIHIYEYEIL